MFIFLLKIDCHSTIYLASSEVIWNGILLSSNVCHPIVRVDIVDTKEVQAVKTKPNILKDSIAMTVVVV